MNTYFDIHFSEDAFDFLKSLERKHYEKILYNLRKTQVHLDVNLFKKVSNDIWEFRTIYNGIHYRLLAFWDKTTPITTLVIVTHGFVKKSSKIPKNEIEKAIQFRVTYITKRELKDK